MILILYRLRWLAFSEDRSLRRKICSMFRYMYLYRQLKLHHGAHTISHRTRSRTTSPTRDALPKPGISPVSVSIRAHTISYRRDPGLRVVVGECKRCIPMIHTQISHPRLLFINHLLMTNSLTLYPFNNVATSVLPACSSRTGGGIST